MEELETRSKRPKILVMTGFRKEKDRTSPKETDERKGKAYEI
jgi:hypothetical protein